MLDTILGELKTGSKCVLLHVNADPDALGCAIALKYAFSEVTIGAVEGLSKTGKFLQKNLGVEVVEKPDVSLFDKIIVVDCGSPDRLGEYQNIIENVIVIDHHLKSERWDTELYYSDENRSSCAELIYEILKMGKIHIDHAIGLSLCAGILTDSGKFNYANFETLRTFADIMQESNVTMEEVLSLFSVEHDTDYSKRISRLKGASRLKYESIDRNIIATSIVGAFESSVCGALLNLGADCAFVGTQRENEFRISARANQSLIKAGLHLGNLLNAIGIENDCEGGGHDGAAGLFGCGDIDAMLNICCIRAKSEIRKLSRS
jgi:nanoRNase/pAp phosphatase (c-di-AMP/oligoRNAs hydrolase)